MERDDAYDTTEPYVAICKQGMSNGVYLVNPTGERLDNVETSTGGFFHVGREVVPAQGGPSQRWTLDARSFVLIETTSDEEFRTLDCWWRVEFDVAGAERRTMTFATSKHLHDVRYCERLPILEQPGLVVRRR